MHNENEWKLTKEEEKRKEVFDKLSEEMRNKGYKQNDLTAGLVEANLLAILTTLPFILIFGILFFVVNRGVAIELSLGVELIAFASFIVLVVVHELIHGFTWGLFAKNHFKAISFGVVWKSLNPYCTCSDPLTRTQYIIGSFMPTLILGFGLAIIATILGNFAMWCVSTFMILGGGGDFLIILKILKYKTQSKDVMYLDHPYKIGLVVFEK